METPFTISTLLACTHLSGALEWWMQSEVNANGGTFVKNRSAEVWNKLGVPVLREGKGQMMTH